MKKRTKKIGKRDDTKLILEEGNDQYILCHRTTLTSVSVETLVKVVLRHKIREGVSCNLTHHGHNPTSDYGLDEMKYICTMTHTED